MADESITFEPRFNGPPASGNGGYVAGTLAARLGVPSVQATLRAPPPLGRVLSLRRDGEGRLSLNDGDRVLVEAQAQSFELALPALPSVDEAEAARLVGRLRAQSRKDDPYDRCFGCGIARRDGLQIIPSPVGEVAQGVVATTWLPSPTEADGQGHATLPQVWTALDCPAGYAWQYRLAGAGPIVTGRITASLDAPVMAGRRYRVLAWPIAQEGRKLHAGSALVDDGDRVVARSVQLWFLTRPEA
jgi:hypothetical protein